MRKKLVMEKGITYVGLDAHKVAINVAMLLPARAGPWSGRRATTRHRFAGW
jgi:hypothetical protein